MATITKGNYITALAGADLHASGYYIAKLDSSGNAVLASASTDEIVGVIDQTQQAGPVPQSTSGGEVTIAIVNGTGTGKVIAGGSITKDGYLTTNSSGQAVTTTTTGDRVFGRARYAANSGDIFEYVKMFFIHP